MSGAAWLQLLALLVLLAISTPLLGSYMAKVYGGAKAPGDRFFGPIERAIYRVCGHTLLYADVRRRAPVLTPS